MSELVVLGEVGVVVWLVMFMLMFLYVVVLVCCCYICEVFVKLWCDICLVSVFVLFWFWDVWDVGLIVVVLFWIFSSRCFELGLFLCFFMFFCWDSLVLYVLCWWFVGWVGGICCCIVWYEKWRLMCICCFIWMSERVLSVRYVWCVVIVMWWVDWCWCDCWVMCWCVVYCYVF